MDRDRLVGLQSLGEVVPLQHAGDRVARAQPDPVRRRELAQPAAVEVDHGPVRIQDLEDLRLEGLGIRFDLLRRQRRTCLGPAGRVADGGGKIADQKDHPMPEVLKVLHLPEQDGVTEVQVRRGRIKSDLDGQRLTGAQRFLKLAAASSSLMISTAPRRK